MMLLRLDQFMERPGPLGMVPNGLAPEPCALLLDHKCEVNVADRYGQSALFYAAKLDRSRGIERARIFISNFIHRAEL